MKKWASRPSTSWVLPSDFVDHILNHGIPIVDQSVCAIHEVLYAMTGSNQCQLADHNTSKQFPAMHVKFSNISCIKLAVPSCKTNRRCNHSIKIPLTISSTEWVNMCYLQKLCRVLFCTVKVMLGTAFCRKQAFCRE